jgi:hypothetical protein
MQKSATQPLSRPFLSGVPDGGISGFPIDCASLNILAFALWSCSHFNYFFRPDDDPQGAEQSYLQYPLRLDLPLWLSISCEYNPSCRRDVTKLWRYYFLHGLIRILLFWYNIYTMTRAEIQHFQQKHAGHTAPFLIFMEEWFCILASIPKN